MNAAPSALIQRHRLSLDDFHRMAEAGVFAPDARVEFIEGEIVDMRPIGSRHAAAVKRLARALHRAVADRALVSVRDPIHLDRHNEPQPDLALLRPREDDYAGALPQAADTLLVIEVADRSAAYDLQVKAPLYARHGIAELWILDLDAGTVRRLRQPHGGEYLEVQASPRPGRVGIAALPGIEIDLDAILVGLIDVPPAD